MLQKMGLLVQSDIFKKIFLKIPWRKAQSVAWEMTTYHNQLNSKKQQGEDLSILELPSPKNVSHLLTLGEELDKEVQAY